MKPEVLCASGSRLPLGWKRPTLSSGRVAVVLFCLHRVWRCFLKVRVSGMAWLPKGDLGPNRLKLIKDQLTIIPRKYTAYDDTPPTPVLCYEDRIHEIGVPRQYFFREATGSHDIKWDLTDGAPINVTSALRQEGPYAEQAVATKAVLDHFRSFDGTQKNGSSLGCILQGRTGFGKTATALAIAQAHARTTVVIVHKEFLLRQWISRIEKFLPDARVGVCRGSKCDFEGKDFVVAMLDSLALEDGSRYPIDFYRWPGLVIVDEVHRIGAPTWSPVPVMFSARHRLGLTAIPRRKDGADDVFWWHIGGIVYQARTETPKIPVRAIYLDLKGPGIIHRDKSNSAIVENIIVRMRRRNQAIVDEVISAVRSPQQRKVLLLSSRLDHLRTLEKMLVEECERRGFDVPTTGFYVGEWFTGEKDFSLHKGKADLSTDEGREKAIKAIYRHFRRARMDPDDKKSDRCAQSVEEGHQVVLYKHGYRTRVLESVPNKGLVRMAYDYGIAQKKNPKEKTKPQGEEELAKAERARVIFATYQMCSEGVDIPAVDTIVFATPVSDVEQAYGRGRRFCVPTRHGGEMRPKDCEHFCPWRHETCTGKPDPVAADIVNQKVPLEAKRHRYRKDFYAAVGVKVKPIRLSG